MKPEIINALTQERNKREKFYYSKKFVESYILIKSFMINMHLTISLLLKKI